MTDAVRTVFFGTGSFAVPILEALARSAWVRLVGVVTGPPRASGRGKRVRRSPIAARADGLGVAPILESARLRDPASVQAVSALAPELVVLADYGQLVPAALLALPPHGALNLHPSLLPRHRGAAPVPATILAGDRQAGVTLMLMDEGLDTGPIVAQVGVPLAGDETTPVLEALLADEAAALLDAVLPGWLAGTRTARPQPSGGATLTRPLRREDGLVDPERTAAELERQVRAYQPWPGTFAATEAGRLIVWAARPLARGIDGVRAPGPAHGVFAASSERLAPPGLLLPDGDGLALAVSDGALRLDEIQLGGGRRMTSADLRRGHPELAGSRLRTPAVA